MPKGGVLHAHSSALASIDLLMKFTYYPHLHVCFPNGKIRFRFTKHPGNDCPWVLLSDLRKTNRSIDNDIQRHFKLADIKYEDINHVWEDFSDIFSTIGGLITYR